jgi:hypothetical protein
MARTTHRLMVLAVVGTMVMAVTAQQACVLAQPSGEVPRLPATRPTIVHPSVVPSTSAVLTHFPETFVVPVELADPTVNFQYAVFVNYDPLLGGGLVEGPTISTFEVQNADPDKRTRTLNISIPAPLEPGRCHVIEVVVGLRLGTKDPKNVHTPDEPGGDIVTWMYNPNGDPGGCPTLDAGIDARADGDAGEGGSE